VLYARGEEIGIRLLRGKEGVQSQTDPYPHKRSKKNQNGGEVLIKKV